MRKIRFQFIAGLLLTCAAVATAGIVINKGFDPDSACVGRERDLFTAISQYNQDYDEKYPADLSQAGFKTAVLPYVHDPAVFVCPDTGVAFLPNSELAGTALALIDVPSTTAFVKDSVAHADGTLDVAFLDGHVERNGVEVLEGGQDTECVSRARQLNLALDQYVQDYDEKFPIMNTQPEFHDALYPYVKSNIPFQAPNSKTPFQPNPWLSGLSSVQIWNPDGIYEFTDWDGLPGHIPTTAFVSGRIVHGSDEFPKSSNSSNLKQLGIALLQYVQDYDETFPPMDTNPHFQAALSPYLYSYPTANVFNDVNTGLPYPINSALGGKSIVSFNSPSTTIAIGPTVISPAGELDAAYVDGHVDSQYNYVASSLTTDINGNPALVWRRLQKGGVVADLDSTGGLTRTHTYRAGSMPTNNYQNLRNVDIAFEMYVQDHDEQLPLMDTNAHFQAALLPYNQTGPSIFYDVATGLPYPINSSLSLKHVGDFPDGASIVVIGPGQPSPTGFSYTVTLDGEIKKSYTGGAISAENIFGAPFGSVATYIGDSRIFESPNSPVAFGYSIPNSASIKKTDPTGAVDSTITVGPYDGWTPSFLAQGQGDQSRMLWRNYSGQLALWVQDSTGNYVSDLRIDEPQSSQPLGMVFGPDKRIRILVQVHPTTARVVTIDTNNTLRYSFDYNGEAGYSIADIAYTSDDQARLLWQTGSGKAEVWTLNVDGSVIKKLPVSLEAAGTAEHLAIDNTGALLILWQKPGAVGVITKLKQDGTLIYSKEYPPYE